MAEHSPPPGVSARNLPPAPRQGTSLSREVVLASLFNAGAEAINKDIGRALLRLADDPELGAARFALGRGAQLQAQLSEHVRRLGLQASDIVRPVARDAYVRGLRQAQEQLNDAGLRDAARAAGSRMTLTQIDHQAIDVIARDTLARMTGALASHAQRGDALFRTLSAGPLSTAEPSVNRAIATGLITGDPRHADRAMRELFRSGTAAEPESYRKLGAKIIEVGGWSGKVSTYVSTVVRTRTREATVRARHERLESLGLDLVQITGNVSKNPCTAFLGLVCSLGEARPGYPALSSLPNSGPPFHPNCSKGTVVFIEGVSSDARQRAHESAYGVWEEQQAA